MVPTENISEIEKCLLGCFLTGAEIPSLLNESMFYDNRHKANFTALSYLFGEGLNPDLIMLNNRLTETGKLEAAGGTAYIASLTNTVPSSANMKYYLDKVIAHSEFRRKALAIRQAHSQLDKAVIDNAIFDELQKTLNDTSVQTDRQTSWTPATLLDHDFPPPKWMIPELFASGLTVLIGAPKIGKSWLALSIAYAVATGGHVFGSIPVEKHDVFYLSLEDTGRRLKERLIMLGAARINNLQLEERWNLGIGGIRNYINQHKKTGLVIIDTWAQFFPKGDFNDYSEMSKRAASLKAVADDLDISIVAMHHTRKGLNEGCDWMDSSLGSQGLVGSADSIIMLRRGRGESDAELKATSRDSKEKNLVLHFDHDCATWTIVGDKQEIQDSETRQLIHDYLKDNGANKPKAIHEGIKDLGYQGSISSVQNILKKMLNQRVVQRLDYGMYSLYTQHELDIPHTPNRDNQQKIADTVSPSTLPVAADEVSTKELEIF